MAYVRHVLTGGLNTKADATSIADGQLTLAVGCSYDTVGAVSSARGRLVLNEGVALAGDGTDNDIRGHFDAFGKRYTKSGTSVYQDYDTLVGTSGQWTGTGHVSGFGYGSYVYLCDGTTVKRYDDATDAVQTWGLVAPGYLELGASPIATTSGVAEIVVTTPSAHGLLAGMIVELHGVLSTNGIPSDQLNIQHTITSATTLTYTITGGTITTTATSTGSGGGSAAIQMQGPNVTTPVGGALTAGTYKWAYTFYNGMAESNFSASVSATAALNDMGTLANVLAGPTGTTERRIYRTDLNGTQLFYVGTLSANVLTDYNDLGKLPPDAKVGAVPGDAIDESDGSLASDDDVRSPRDNPRYRNSQPRREQKKVDPAPQVVATNLGLLSAWTDHDPPPSNLENVIIVNEQVFGISGNEVRFSAVGNPEHWPITNRIIPGKDAGETLKCIRAFDRDVIVYTDSGLYRLTQIGLSFEDSRFEAIESPVGTTSKRGVAVLDGQQGHVFIANTGLYLFDGQRVQEASLMFDTLFDQSELLSGYRFNTDYNGTVIVEALRDKLYISYGYASDNDQMMIVDFESVGDPKATVFVFDATTLFRERTTNRLICGSSTGHLSQMDYNYAIYDSEASTADPIDTTSMSITTKQFQLAGGAAFALDEVVFEASTLADGADVGSATHYITVTVRGRGISNAATFTVSSVARTRHKFKCPQHMKGEDVQVSFVSDASFQRLVYAVGFTYRPFQEEP